VCSKYILKKQFRLHTKLHEGAADTLGRGDDLDTSREDEQEEEMDEQDEEDEMEEGEASVTNTNQKEVSSTIEKLEYSQCCGSGIRCLFDPWIREPE
jgi:hypothetical protein